MAWYINSRGQIGQQVCVVERMICPATIRLLAATNHGGGCPCICTQGRHDNRGAWSPLHTVSAAAAATTCKMAYTSSCYQHWSAVVCNSALLYPQHHHEHVLTQCAHRQCILFAQYPHWQPLDGPGGDSDDGASSNTLTSRSTRTVSHAAPGGRFAAGGATTAAAASGTTNHCSCMSRLGQPGGPG